MVNIGIVRMVRLFAVRANGSGSTITNWLAGSERFVRQKVNNTINIKSILKVNPHDTPEMDSKITFTIPLESVYLFDGESEKVIK